MAFLQCTVNITNVLSEFTNHLAMTLPIIPLHVYTSISRVSTLKRAGAEKRRR